MFMNTRKLAIRVEGAKPLTFLCTINPLTYSSFDLTGRISKICSHALSKCCHRMVSQGMDRPGVWQFSEGSGEQGKMEKTGCKIICGAPTTLAVKGLMMMMMMSKRWILKGLI